MSQRPKRVASRQPRVVAGFKTLFVSLLVAGILGAGVRLYFSPRRIEAVLRSQIERAHLPFKIEFKSAHLTLSRGLFATFAIDVVDVRLSHYAPCATEAFVDSGLVMLPLDWWALARGHLQLGWVVADAVHLSADRLQCEAVLPLKPTPQPTDAAPTSYSSREPQELRPFFRTEDIDRIRNIIAGFEIQNATIYFDQSKKSVQIPYLDIWHKVNELALKGSVSLPPDLTYGENFPAINFSGTAIPDLVKIEAKSSFDEGGLGALIELAPTEDVNDPHAKVLFSADGMPLSVFSDYLKKVGVLSNAKLQPKFLWLTCEASSEGSIHQIVKHTPLRIDNCSMEGDPGEIAIGPAVRDENGDWQPFKVEIKHFVVGDLLSAFGEKGPSGVMSSFGLMKGTLQYLGKDHQSFEGTLEDAEVFFSNRKERATQKISSVSVSAERAEGKVNGKVSNIVLDPGKVSGEMTFAFDSRFKSGTMSIDTQELSLDTRIQKLMADGLFEHLQLKGVAKLELGKFVNWKGRIASTSYTGSQLKILKPIVETKFDGKSFDIFAQAAAGEISPQSKWLGWIRSAAGDLKITTPADQWIPISNLKNQVSIQPQLVSWKNAALTVTQSKALVTSTGEIRDDREAAGLLTVAEPGKKARKFTISGSPSNPNLKEQE